MPSLLDIRAPYVTSAGMAGDNRLLPDYDDFGFEKVLTEKLLGNLEKAIALCRQYVRCYIDFDSNCKRLKLILLVYYYH